MKREIEKHNIIVEKFFVKVMEYDDKRGFIRNQQLLYRGKIPNIADREKNYINSFFHPEKKILWNLIKSIQYEPESFYKFGQTPRYGMIAYGPPGTGKSSFAYRVAMSLNRHIISIDLRHIRKREKLYSLIKKPIVNDCYVEPKDVVFIFDEFDLALKELCDKDLQNITIRKKKSNPKDDIYKTKGKDELFDESSTDIPILTDDEYEDSSAPVSTGIELRSPKKQRPRRLRKTRTTRNLMFEGSDDDTSDESIIQVSKPQTVYSTNKSDIQISDILELLQGPVPIEGAIIIATTNDINYIRKKNPALVRPGRLTPVYFGYPTMDILNEISQYYFSQALEFVCEDKKIGVPPSEIIELAQKSNNLITLMIL
jgi:SpoVK/Ycf46/Vps4 family AAA+-type ATPase